MGKRMLCGRGRGEGGRCAGSHSPLYRADGSESKAASTSKEKKREGGDERTGNGRAEE